MSDVIWFVAGVAYVFFVLHTVRGIWRVDTITASPRTATFEAILTSALIGWLFWIIVFFVFPYDDTIGRAQ